MLKNSNLKTTVVDHLHRPVGMISRENLTQVLLRKTTRAYLKQVCACVVYVRVNMNENGYVCVYIYMFV